MSEVQLSAETAQWANDLLVWIGFGTLVGLVAKAVMPGRDPGGALTTLLMGIVGTVIGSGALMFLWKVERVTPISPLGFVSAIGGAFVLLLFYRLFAGFYIDDTGVAPLPRRRYNRRPAPRRRRRYDYEYDSAGYDD